MAPSRDLAQEFTDRRFEIRESSLVAEITIREEIGFESCAVIDFRSAYPLLVIEQYLGKGSCFRGHVPGPKRSAAKDRLSTVLGFHRHDGNKFLSGIAWRRKTVAAGFQNFPILELFVQLALGK